MSSNLLSLQNLEQMKMKLKKLNTGLMELRSELVELRIQSCTASSSHILQLEIKVKDHLERFRSQVTEEDGAVEGTKAYEDSNVLSGKWILLTLKFRYELY